MTTFGDKDLLDVWDDGDPLAVRLVLLARLMERFDGYDDARRLVVRRLAAKVAAALGGL
jgi:hypothetical protein